LSFLVIGGNGFIGTHLVDRLLESGRSVRIYDHSPNKFRALPPKVEYVEGELGNYGLVREALEGMEVVYHFVSTTSPKTSNDDPVYDVCSNLLDTIKLLETCTQSGVGKVIFTSSGGTVYGPPETLPLTERHPTNPTSSYGIVKLAIEKYLALFRRLHGLDYFALRISNPYGPNQDPTRQQGVISAFLHRLHTGEPIKIWGDGSVVRDYLYVSDLVDALEHASEVEPREPVINLGSGCGISLNELLRLMADIVGERPAVEYLSARALDVPAVVLDISRAGQELGWSPKTELAEGITRTWDWIRTLSERGAEF
jgi:UDP-glucose 4-epimerase